MVKHIVMWKLKDEAEGKSKQANALELKKRLEDLKGKVPDIVELEVGLQMGPDETASDVILVTLFKDKAGLDNYQKHPDHQKVIPFVKQVVSERRVVDYEI